MGFIVWLRLPSAWLRGGCREDANHQTAETRIFIPVLFQLSHPAHVLACRGAEGRGDIGLERTSGSSLFSIRGRIEN
jgi:hypothetical protein